VRRTANSALEGLQYPRCRFLVFGGTRYLESGQRRASAAATMSSIVAGPGKRGLVRRNANDDGRRVPGLEATSRCTKILQEGRKAGLMELAKALRQLSE